MIKADGTLAIHSDGNASKPLNWMIAPNVITEHDDRWEVTNTKSERLTIWVSEIIEDVTHDLGDDPGLVKDGVEAHLQELLAAGPETLEEGSSSFDVSTRPTSALSTSSAPTPMEGPLPSR